MTLAEAISTVAMAGCRLVPDDAGGVALVVPEGTTVARQVLEVLRAHREQLGAAHRRPPASATAAAAAEAGEALAIDHDDLADYLYEKGVSDTGVELVTLAARIFNVRGESITVELPAKPDEPVAFFEPGIPIVTTVSTKWHKPGAGYFELPAGTLGLAIPQPWAIADPVARQQLAGAIDLAKRQGKPTHVAVWLAGEPRALDLDSFTFDGAVAPAGLDLLPWRAGAAAA